MRNPSAPNVFHFVNACAICIRQSKKNKHFLTKVDIELKFDKWVAAGVQPLIKASQVQPHTSQTVPKSLRSPVVTASSGVSNFLVTPS